MLLQIGVSQGIRSILVATALAMVALGVDASLATPGLVLLPLGLGIIILAAKLAELRIEPGTGSTASALDEDLERRVLAVCLARADSGGIVVVATHRDALLQQADRVLELRNGEMAEWGRTEETARLH